VAFHSGEAWVAPITNIVLPEHNGGMHINPGYLRSSSEICVKIVTCFYDNPRLGIPTRDGAIVLADRSNGRMKALLGEAPEGKGNYRDHVIRPGDVSPAGLREKARHVLGEMGRRMGALGFAWKDSTAVQVYTVHDLHPFWPTKS
jgi:hypothetical protein